MSIDFLQHISLWMAATLSLYGPLAVYCSVFLLGENAILAAFLLSAQGYISPQTVFLFAVLGSLSADIFWYIVATTGIKRFYKPSITADTADQSQMFFVRLADRHTFLFLIGIKFLVGLRIFLTMYIVLKKHISFGMYVFFNAIGTVLFVGVLYPLGWFLGKGVSAVLFVEKSFVGILSLVIIAMILVNVLPRLITIWWRRIQRNH